MNKLKIVLLMFLCACSSSTQPQDSESLVHARDAALDISIEMCFDCATNTWDCVSAYYDGMCEKGRDCEFEISSLDLRVCLDSISSCGPLPVQCTQLF